MADDEDPPRGKHFSDAVDVVRPFPAEGGAASADGLDVRLDWPEEDRAGSSRDTQQALTDVRERSDAPAASDAGTSTLAPAAETVVPLLPAIAGRIDALDGQLRALGMRLDVLASSIGAMRSAIGDRVDTFAETTAAAARQAEQATEEQRRASERAVGELRRTATAADARLQRMSARLDEIATDVSSLLDAMSGAGPSASDVASLADGVARIERQLATQEHEDDEQARQAVLDAVASVGTAVAGLREHLDERAAETPRHDLALVDGITALHDAVARLTAAGVDAATASHVAAVERTLVEVRTLVEAVVDTMPASAEGTGADAAQRIADAVVARLDLEDLARRVARHLEETFEVVSDPPR